MLRNTINADLEYDSQQMLVWTRIVHVVENDLA